MKKEYKKLTTEAMNKIILEKIPLTERLRSVYLPIIATDCACYLLDEMFKLLGTLRLDATKALSRDMHRCVECYRLDNWQVMRSDLYRTLEKSTKEFYLAISKDIMVHRVQFHQAILDRHLEFDTLTESIIAVACVVREILKYAIDLDRNFSERISDLLGNDIKYTTEDNGYCLRLIEDINKLLLRLGSPTNLRTEQTDLALKVFKVKLNSVII